MRTDPVPPKSPSPEPGLLWRLTPFLGIGAFFGLWELYVLAFGVKPIVLPEPTGIVSELVSNPGFYARHSLVTLLEAVAGSALAFGIATMVSVGMVLSPVVERASWPVLIMVQSTPIVVLAPILFSWFGFSYVPIVIMASLFVVIPLTSAMFTGFRSVDRDTLEVARSVDASRAEIFWRLRVHYALPTVLSIARVGFSLALLGAVIGEMAGSRAGLGHTFKTSLSTHLVYQASYAVFCAAFLGIMATSLVSLTERRLLRWHSSQDSE